MTDTTDPTADGQNRQFLTTLASLGIATHRLDQIRDAARLHQQQLIGTSELYAVIEADAPTSAVVPAADRAAVLAEAIARVEDPQERAKTTTGLGLGWEAARDVLVRMLAAGSAAVDRVTAETPPAETQQPAIRCNHAHLRHPHDPHGWEPQPGMDPIRCPGFTAEQPKEA